MNDHNQTIRPRLAFTGWLARSAVSLALVFVCACATPIGVRSISQRQAQRNLTASFLSTGELSPKAEIVLRRTNLSEKWKEDPAAVIDQIHEAVARPMNDYDRETRLGYMDSIAELCFAHASRTGDRRYYLAAAIYAWVYLFAPKNELSAPPLDRGRRLAADLYNQGLTLGFTDPETGIVLLRDGEHELPFGSLAVDIDEESLVWGGQRLTDFASLADLKVRGLLNRYHRSGLGAPLAARLESIEEADAGDAIFDQTRVPVAAVLRLDALEFNEAGVATRFHGQLSVHAYSEADAIEIEGEFVPLEFEPSAALALQLEEDPPWKRELSGFFQGDLAIEHDGLLALQPYQPGRIPLVLVHGTASSVGRWADMVNDLWSDPAIRRNYQVVLFSYNTGNPIAYSAFLLRNAIEGLLSEIDPEGRDPALRDMVVMGHSQGGLLAKLLVVDSGDALWNLLSDKPPEELDLRPESRRILEGSLIIEPLESVDSVIFLSTPHRGSRLATLGPARLLGRLVRSPANLVNATVDLVGGDADATARRRLERGSGSIGNMSPNSEFIQTLAELPIAPDVDAHSIIGVQKEPKETGGDGVVSYQSAHLDDVDSEFVVRSGHSSQSNPLVVGEVRRILIEHLSWAKERQGITLGTGDSVEAP